VAAEQQHLPRLERRGTAGDLAVDDGQRGGGLCGTKVDVAQQGQGLPARIEGKPVAIGGRDDVAVLLADTVERIDQQAQFGVAGARPVILAVALLGGQAGPQHAADQVVDHPLWLASPPQCRRKQLQGQRIDPRVVMRRVGDKSR
jgi:hypothetical protein